MPKLPRGPLAWRGLDEKMQAFQGRNLTYTHTTEETMVKLNSPRCWQTFLEFSHWPQATTDPLDTERLRGFALNSAPHYDNAYKNSTFNQHL